MVDEHSIIHRRHVDGGPIEKATKELEDTIPVADGDCPDDSLAADDVRPTTRKS